MFKPILLKTALMAALIIFINISVSAQSRVSYSIRVLEQEMARMARKVDSLQDTVAGYNSKLNSMNKQINILRDENKRLRLQIVAMQRALNAERIARGKSMKKVIDTVAGQVSAVQKRQAPSPASGRSKQAPGPVGNGDFVKYTVQPGATLSVIAKAYKVSISDIMKANKLKSANRIRAGQVLFIPQK